MFLKHFVKICVFVFLLHSNQLLNAQNRQLFPVQKDGFWGLINEKGKVIEPFIYLSYVKSIDRSGSKIKLWDGKKITIVSATNKVVLPDSVSELVNLDQGNFAAYKNGKCYLTDSLGNRLLSQSFNYLLTTKTPGLYEFCGNGSNGVINSKGQTILKFPLIEFSSLKNGVFSVKNRGEYTLFNASGRAIVKDTFQKVDVWNLGSNLISGIYPYSGGRILDFEGNELFRYPKSMKISNLGSGFLKCEAEEKGARIYDLLKKRFLTFKFNSVDQSLLPNSIIYKIDKLYYFYFRDDTVQRAGYNRISMFDTFIQLENQAGKIGFFDRQLNEILPFEFSNVMAINDELIGLSKNSELYAVHTKSKMLPITAYKYTHFLAGSGYLKAYSKGKAMDLYDMDVDGNLSNLMAFNNVSSFYIQRKNTNNSSFSVLGNTSNSNVQRNRNIKWQYVLINGKSKLQLLSCSKKDSLCDTLIPPIYDSLILVTNSYSVILKKAEKRFYDSINRTYQTVVKKLQYLVEHENYTVFDTAFDYIALNELENANLNQFLAIKTNTKHVLINRRTLSMTEEYDYISNIEGNLRRAVPKGKWVKTNFDLWKYQGSLISKKYTIIGNWVILDSLNNNLKIKGILESDSLTDIQPMFKDNYIGQKNFTCVFVFNASGQILIPCNYQNIQTEYVNGNYYYVTSIWANKFSILNANGVKINSELYDDVLNKGELCQLSKNGQKYALNSEAVITSLPENGSIVQFKSGAGFLKIGKKTYGVSTDLTPSEDHVFSSAYPFVSDFTIAKYQNKWGVIDKAFNWKLSPKLMGNCGPVFYSSFIASDKGKTFFMGFDGQPVVAPQNNPLPQKEIAKGLFTYLNRNETIVSDRNGNEIARKKGEIKTVSFKDGIVFNTLEKGIFFNSTSQKHQLFNDTFDLNDLDQQLYHQSAINKKVIDFTEFQKFAYGIKDYFRPVLAKGNLTQGKFNCFLYQKGIMQNRYEGPTGWIVSGGNSIPVFSNQGCPYKLVNFHGGIFIDEPISGIRMVDSNSIMVGCAKSLTGVVSNYGTWIIPPVYKKVRKLPGGNYAVNHEQVSHLYDINGKKMDIQFTEYLIDSDYLVFWNFGNMGLYDAAINKKVWE